MVLPGGRIDAGQLPGIAGPSFDYTLKLRVHDWGKRSLGHEVRKYRRRDWLAFLALGNSGSISERPVSRAAWGEQQLPFVDRDEVGCERETEGAAMPPSWPSGSPKYTTAWDNCVASFGGPAPHEAAVGNIWHQRRSRQSKTNCR